MVELINSQLYFDAVACEYDDLYMDAISQAENAVVADVLRDMCCGKRVLDIGCGSGLGYELLSVRCGQSFEYVGIDISGEMIREARRRWPDAGNAQFHVMDGVDLSSLSAASFDCVVSLFGAFSHIIERDQAIMEIARVLRRGGQVMLMLYSRFSIRNLWLGIRTRQLSHFMPLHPYQIRNDVGGGATEAWFYEPASVQAMLDGFEDIEIRGLNALLVLPWAKAALGLCNRSSRARRYLGWESRVLDRFPEVCHSLLVSATRGSSASPTPARSSAGSSPR